MSSQLRNALAALGYGPKHEEPAPPPLPEGQEFELTESHIAEAMRWEPSALHALEEAQHMSRTAGQWYIRAAAPKGSALMAAKKRDSWEDMLKGVLLAMTSGKAEEARKQEPPVFTYTLEVKHDDKSEEVLQTVRIEWFDWWLSLTPVQKVLVGDSFPKEYWENLIQKEISLEKEKLEAQLDLSTWEGFLEAFQNMETREISLKSPHIWRGIAEEGMWHRLPNGVEPVMTLKIANALEDTVAAKIWMLMEEAQPFIQEAKGILLPPQGKLTFFGKKVINSKGQIHDLWGSLEGADGTFPEVPSPEGWFEKVGPMYRFFSGEWYDDLFRVCASDKGIRITPGLLSLLKDFEGYSAFYKEIRKGKNFFLPIEGKVVSYLRTLKKLDNHGLLHTSSNAWIIPMHIGTTRAGAPKLCWRAKEEGSTLIWCSSSSQSNGKWGWRGQLSRPEPGQEEKVLFQNEWHSNGGGAKSCCFLTYLKRGETLKTTTGVVTGDK